MITILWLIIVFLIGVIALLVKICYSFAHELRFTERMLKREKRRKDLIIDRFRKQILNL
jgi:hypothetical protein